MVGFIVKGIFQRLLCLVFLLRNSILKVDWLQSLLYLIGWSVLSQYYQCLGFYFHHCKYSKIASNASLCRSNVLGRGSFVILYNLLYQNLLVSVIHVMYGMHLKSCVWCMKYILYIVNIYISVVLGGLHIPAVVGEYCE